MRKTVCFGNVGGTVQCHNNLDKEMNNRIKKIVPRSRPDQSPMLLKGTLKSYMTENMNFGTNRTETYSQTPTASSSRNMVFGFTNDKLVANKRLDKQLMSKSLFAEKEAKNLDDTIRKIKYIMN